MNEITTILSVSLGALLAAILLATLVYWYVRDITQKKHAILRNYPIG